MNQSSKVSKDGRPREDTDVDGPLREEEGQSEKEQGCTGAGGTLIGLDSLNELVRAPEERLVGVEPSLKGL